MTIRVVERLSPQYRKTASIVELMSSYRSYRMSVNPRMNRLFAQNGKCLQVALDHGVANVPSFLPGMENMKQVVSAVAAANPDAILLTTGQAHWLQDLTQNPKPALVMRADVTNFYAFPRRSTSSAN